MRIIAGKWRGRKLVAPKGDATRPTADRTRETLFNMLVSQLGTFEDLHVADLFAGSGALGLEALSRGAHYCHFVEQDKSASKALRTNISTLNAGALSEITESSVMTLGPAKFPLDLILLDPPYDTGAGQVALDRLARLGWIGPGSWAALETGRNEKISLSKFQIERERTAGKAKLTLLRLASS